MAITKEGRLSKCFIDTNCVLVEWKFRDSKKAFSELCKLASELPRSTLLETNEMYWHGVIRSLIFRFPDDLELLRIPNEGIIQVRSASRIGASDLGVNRARVEDLKTRLLKIKGIDDSLI